MEKIYTWFKYKNEASSYFNKIKNKDILFLSKEISNHQHKKYLVCKYDEFFETLQGFEFRGYKIPPMKKENILYHNMLLSNYPIKFFIDIEGPYLYNTFLKNEDYFEKYIIKKLLLIMTLLLKDKFNLIIDCENDFIFLSACSEEKFSFHIHCDKIIFDNKISLYNFVSYSFFKCHEELKNDNSLYITKKNLKETHNIPIVDIEECKSDSLRGYFSTKKNCVNDPNRRLRLYNWKNKLINPNFDLNILKKTLIHYDIDTNNLINWSDPGNKKSEVIIFKNDIKKYNDNEIIHHTIDISNFGNFFTNFVNDIIEIFKTKFDIPLIKTKSTTPKPHSYGIEFNLKGDCLISIIFLKRNHKNTKNNGLFLNLNNKSIKPCCFNTDCKTQEALDYVSKNMTIIIKDDLFQKINIILNNNFTQHEKIKKLQEFEEKKKEIKNIFNIHSISLNDL